MSPGPDSDTTTRRVRRALLVINPNSRSADSADMHEGIARLEQAGITVSRFESGGPEDTNRAIEDRQESTDLVILAGGDGTLHAAIPALHRCRLPLAILPLGTGNDFARSLGIPLDLEQAFTTIIEGRSRLIDLGRVNGKLFLNAASVGLGVQVSHSLTAELKRNLGVFSYLKALFDSLSRSRAFRVSLDVDGRHYRLRSIQLAVGNGRFYGGGNIIHEEATIDEGMMHLYSIKPLGFWQLLILAPLWRSGRHGESQNTFTTSGRRFSIRTSPSMELHTDGEPATRTPAEMEVLPQALEVISPRESEA